MYRNFRTAEDRVLSWGPGPSKGHLDLMSILWRRGNLYHPVPYYQLTIKVYDVSKICIVQLKISYIFRKRAMVRQKSSYGTG